MVLQGKGKIPKDLSWGAAKKGLMGNIDQMLNSLKDFDKDNTPDNACTYVEQKYISQSYFNYDSMKSKSGAAAGMAAWVINICKYFRFTQLLGESECLLHLKQLLMYCRIYQYVEPKRIKLKEANGRLDSANTKLEAVRKQVAELEAKLADLTEKFESATKEKNDAIAAAEKTQRKASMAGKFDFFHLFSHSKYAYEGV